MAFEQPAGEGDQCVAFVQDDLLDRASPGDPERGPGLKRGVLGGRSRIGLCAPAVRRRTTAGGKWPALESSRSPVAGSKTASSAVTNISPPKPARSTSTESG